MKTLASLIEDYGPRIDASAGPLADWQMYQEMENARLNRTPIPGRGKLVGCGCIFYRIAVRADGAYVPCVMLPQMVLGHIGKDPLEEVWRNSPQLNALRSRVTIPLETFEDCRGCEYLMSCTGSCAGVAYSFSKNPNLPSPESCLRKFKREIAAEGLSIF